MLPAPTSAAPWQPASAYVFDGTDLVAEQLAALTEALDAWTKAGLAETGIRRGGKVADAGAGSGTIAAWMAGQVGETGFCAAVDKNIEHLPPHPGVTIVKHDLTAGEFPGSGYDLIHSRLVTIHLRRRVEVVGRLARALAPGGELVLHEFDCTWPRPAFCDNATDAALFTKVCNRINDVLAVAGVHLAWGSAAHNALRAAGLEDVRTEFHAETFTGGSPWARWAAINTLQLHEKLITGSGGSAVTASDLERFRDLMADPAFTATSYLAARITGRRPHL